MKSIFLTLIVIFSSLTSQAFRVVGYLPSYRFGIVNTFEYQKLTHLMISFSNPNTNGKFTYSQNLTNVVAKAHAKNCKVFISIGGGGLPASVEDIYRDKTTETERPALISSLMDFVRTYGLDGIDVDLESSLMSMSTYNPFVRELIDSAHAGGVEVSAAFAKYTGSNVEPQTAQKLDFVNTMSYDATGPWQPNNVGQHSPMSQTQSDYSFWRGKGVEEKNIVIGVPFYGYEFKTDKTVPAWTWCDIVNTYPGAIDDDEVSTADGTVYYNGRTTIAAKTQYAIDNAGGIMIWEIGQDCSGSNSLLDVIVDKMAENNMNVGVKETQEIEVSVYPNPAGNVLNVSEGFVGKVLIYNMVGELIEEASEYQNTIDLQALTSGLYIIHLKNNEGTATKTIVKK
jgi:GH18 family chitinase